MTKRFLARKVIDRDGKTYPLSIVSVGHDLSDITITPFVQETASTIMVDGTLFITSDAILVQRRDGSTTILIKSLSYKDC